MNKELLNALTHSLEKAQRNLEKAKTTSDKHYARKELQQAREDMASFSQLQLDEYDRKRAR